MIIVVVSWFVSMLLFLYYDIFSTKKSNILYIVNIQKNWKTTSAFKERGSWQRNLEIWLNCIQVLQFYNCTCGKKWDCCLLNKILLSHLLTSTSCSGEAGTRPTTAGIHGNWQWFMLRRRNLNPVIRNCEIESKTFASAHDSTETECMIHCQVF